MSSKDDDLEEINKKVWDWTDAKPPVAPLSASLKPSDPVVPTYTDTTGPTTKMAQAGVTNATAKGLEAGYKAYTAAANPVGPLGAEQLGASFAKDMAAQGVASTAAPLAAETVAASAVPIAAETAAIGASTAAAGTAAAGTAAAGTAAASTAAGAGLAAGGQAALAAMGPIGWAIGAGLLAKKLGIF